MRHIVNNLVKGESEILNGWYTYLVEMKGNWKEEQVKEEREEKLGKVGKRKQ